MRSALALLAVAALAATASCDLIKHRDVRRIAIRYCDADVLNQWDVRRGLLSETALKYDDTFPPFPKQPRMRYGPGRLSDFQIEKLFVDWPLATVRVRARFDIPSDIIAAGERASVSEDGWYTVKIYLRREDGLWKVDELATKKQWISAVVGPDYGEAWIKEVTGEQP